MSYYSTRSVLFGGRTASVTTKLVIINVVVFVLQILFLNRFLGYLGLVPSLAVGKFWLWQFVTYMFLHGGFFHLFFNMLVLWMFGREIENYWGSSEFLKYYFVTGIGAGITNCVFMFPSSVPTIGASGAIFGLLLAYGMTYPDRYIYLYFLFPIKAKYLVLILGAIELLAVATPGADGIARFAHLGGLLFGYVYLKKETFGHGIRRVLARSTRQRKLKVLKFRDEEEAKERERVDAILDKISRDGIDSLTNEERDFLRRAGRRRREP
ncbi:MAG: rhomboid family intramembrane serine protease [Candidatus Eisenbacteria bacterium]|nr:rhomboid family intramembrane serine protease [Candidatus Eisenbacteria bacterium]